MNCFRRMRSQAASSGRAPRDMIRVDGPLMHGDFRLPAPPPPSPIVASRSCGDANPVSSPRPTGNSVAAVLRSVVAAAAAAAAAPRRPSERSHAEGQAEPASGNGGHLESIGSGGGVSTTCAPVATAAFAEERHDRVREACDGQTDSLSAELVHHSEPASEGRGPGLAGGAAAAAAAIASGGGKAADWERLPLDVWDSVWHHTADELAQMALCLTHPCFWERWHAATLEALLDADLGVCQAKFVVRHSGGRFVHPADVVYLQMEAKPQLVAWFRMLDDFMRRACGAAVPHESFLVVPPPVAVSEGDLPPARRHRRSSGGAASDTVPIELRCQLPGAFSPGGTGRPQNLRTGFCWGHMPAHYGGVQLCLLVSGSARGAQYWYDVKVKLRRQGSTLSPKTAVTRGSQPVSAEENPPPEPSAEDSPPGSSSSSSSSRLVLELVSMSSIRCPV